MNVVTQYIYAMQITPLQLSYNFPVRKDHSWQRFNV